MKINFDYIFKNLDGTNVVDENKHSLTLRVASCNSLLGAVGNVNPSQEDKVKRYLLAVAIDGGKDELTTEEVVFLQKCISDYYISPLIVGQAYEVMEDGNSSKTG